MTPTDILPARIPTAADTGAVRSTSGKAGQDGKDEGEAGFRDLLKQIAGDKSGEKSSDTSARGKDAAAHSRTRTLDAAKAALAELRGRQGKDARVRDNADKTAEPDAEAGATAEDADVEGVATDATEAAGSSTNAVAMLLSLAHKGDTSARNQTSGGKGGAASPDPTLGDDAAATTMADKALRDVKITSVKVETHFAAVRTDAATTGFAQRLALSQMSSGNGQSGAGNVDAAKGKPEGKLGLDATAVSGTEKTSDVRASRGQMFAARGDHRGADTAGQGAAKSGGEGKSAAATIGAAPTERTATPNVDAGQGAQIATPLQQLSNRLLATAHELQQAESATPASSVGAENASAPPVRVLSINLHPEELGSVTVRMSMVAGSLDVQIDAEMPDTAQMLRTDSDQITDMLRSAGIQVDGVTVRAASPDFVSTSGGSTGSFFDQQPQSQSGGASSDGRGAGGQHRGDDPSQSFGRGTNIGQDDESRTQRGRGAGLYV